MAAQPKVGLDYFSFDVNLLGDRKFRKLRLKYGYMAVMIYISILTLIYKDKGYYVSYNDPADVQWDVLDDLKGKYQPTAETVAEVIEDLVACELFSGDQFKSKILTSKRIQANYYRATVERKTVSIDSNIWELTLEEMKELSAKHSYYLFLSSTDNQPINEDNQPINSTNQPINTQSKVKESKVKYSKGKESKGNSKTDLSPPTQQEVEDYFKAKNASGTKFFNYYNTTGWLTRYGQPVINWKSLADNWIATEYPNKNNEEPSCSYDREVFDQMLLEGKF